jgi:hypothetical protein
MSKHKFYFLSGARSTIAEAEQADVSAHALGLKLENIIRFQGMPGALSVAEHQVLCYRMAQNMYPYDTITWLGALTHDVGESFTGDYHGLLKTPEQRAVEREIEIALELRGWLFLDSERVKAVDMAALEVEKSIIWGGAQRPYLAGWSELVTKVGAYDPR